MAYMNETPKDYHNELIMLGTGSAFPRRSYNACFIVRTPELLWLTDGGGGNGIFDALKRAGVAPGEIRHLFVTHAHTDHILGVVWVLRSLVNMAIEGRYDGKVNVYANSPTADALIEICRLTFLKSYFDTLMEIMELHVVAPGDSLTVGDVGISFFDVGSENVAQTGYRMTLPSGRTFATLGDEALTERNTALVRGADYLLCGAFCRYADREVFRPYEKHHFTVRDVAEAAEQAGLRTLIIFHSEDVTPDKGEAYAAEASRFFSGRVVIPADGDRLEL